MRFINLFNKNIITFDNGMYNKINHMKMEQILWSTFYAGLIRELIKDTDNVRLVLRLCATF